MTPYFSLPRGEYFTLLVVLITYLLVGPIYGICAGVIVTAAIFIREYIRTSGQSVIYEVHTAERKHSTVERSLVEQKMLRAIGDAVCVVKLQGYLFFGNTITTIEQLKELVDLVSVFNCISLCVYVVLTEACSNCRRKVVVSTNTG